MSREATAMEIGSLAVRADRVTAKMKRDAERLARALGWQDHYRRVFCDPETGELTNSAIKVLADVSREANFGVFDPTASNDDLRMNEGSRRVILHMFARLNLGSDELLNLSRKMREQNHD